MKSYSFSVDDVKNIDVNRIICEQAEAGNDISLICAKGHNEHYLLISNEFLGGFRREDNVIVCGEPLSLGWGYGVCTAIQDGMTDFRLSPDGFRMCGRWNEVTESPSELKEQIAFARQYKRKITINVYTL